MVLLVALSLLVKSRLALVPKNTLANFIEAVVEGLYNMFSSITAKSTDKFFPLLATIFIFIIAANWIGLLPGVGSIEIRKTAVLENEHEAEVIPLFRGTTADLNFTIALALISVLAVQYHGLVSLGPKIYISKFINFKNPINFFVGILEIISEISRVISFAFRLFGNIFAGEVLLTIVAFLTPLIVPLLPLPFLVLEVFIGFIQALVFSMLTAVLLNLASTHEAH